MEVTKHLKKQTPVEHEILSEIQNRWSPRVFADTPISKSQLKHIFEAGRWAASSYNMQPWTVIYGIKGDETYDRIYNCLHEFNQGWAGNAQVLMITAFKTTNNDGGDYFHALHDLGQFAANMTIQAQHNGIAMHQMAGVDRAKAKKEFKFPEEYHVATAIAMGYYGGDPDVLPEDLKDMELEEKRQRKKIEDFTFNGNFEDK